MVDVGGRHRRWVLPAIPFVFSLVLSLTTLGSTVFWQDSGFYLTAVHEFSVLYPHGFVLYLALCKAWTAVAAPLFGFTAAVHLFSAGCAAGAAAFAGRAAAAFLRRIDRAAFADEAGAAAGCLLAAGYSFWHSGQLAKTYALFYLCVAALLWLLAAAENRRDFLLLGAVLGCCWAAHPSAVLLIPAVLAVVRARRDRIREVGWTWAGAGAAIAIVTALVPSLFVPLLASRESVWDFDAPGTTGELFNYLRGRRYTDHAGAFGFDSGRIGHAASFLWEEYLGVGLALLGAGAFAVFRSRPRLLALLAAWLVPSAGTALAFRAEGQLDMWLVIALYLPSALLVAAGVQAIAARRKEAAAGAVAVGLAWMIVANFSDLNQRGYLYAEQFARYLVKNLEPGSTLFLAFDDSIATVSWLQTVKGEGGQVTPVVGDRLGLPWYDRRLARLPGVRIPDWEASFRAMPNVRQDSFELVAYANENAGPGRAIFSEKEPDARCLRPDLAVVPAGMLWKICVRSEARLDPRYWDYPADVLALSKDVRRPRGVTGAESRPEPFEYRLLLRLLHARLRLADVVVESAPQAALDQYEIVRRAAPAFLDDERFLFQWAVALFKTSRHKEAEEVFVSLLGRTIGPRIRALCRYHLGEISWSRGRRDEARSHFEEALRSGALNEPWKNRIESRLRQP